MQSWGLTTCSELESNNSINITEGYIQIGGSVKLWGAFSGLLWLYLSPLDRWMMSSILPLHNCPHHSSQLCPGGKHNHFMKGINTPVLHSRILVQSFLLYNNELTCLYTVLLYGVLSKSMQTASWWSTSWQSLTLSVWDHTSVHPNKSLAARAAYLYRGLKY